MHAISRYTITKVQLPLEKDIGSRISWLCSSLGFLEKRDKDRTAMKILEALIKALPSGKGLTSDELTEVVKPTRGSVIYHLKKLMKAGIIVKIESRYELRQKSMVKTLEDLQVEINSAIEGMKEACAEIDEELGLR
ncbi:winged helix-turn-helix transcriptional regulator [Candidatus Woesearchaeota archaeon]|nr:winged helix-turn-helix transcriptional regulator [Candidatus Woesearchaeota archaeon]